MGTPRRTRNPKLALQRLADYAGWEITVDGTWVSVRDPEGRLQVGRPSYLRALAFAADIARHRKWAGVDGSGADTPAHEIRRNVIRYEGPVSGRGVKGWERAALAWLRGWADRP